MKEFLSDDFLLQSDTAKWLYNIARKEPIIDFHNHLSAKEIYENRNYDNITEVWLGHDHYKWRAMRSNGIDEKYVTGDASDYDKYTKWAETVPRLIGSPLYHWNHLEMKRYFDYDKPLTSKTAEEFWNIANNKLSLEDFRPRELLVKMNVIELCTTDDPVDDLEYHKKLQAEEKRFKVRPTFRPDKALNILREDYNEYLADLEKTVGYSINSCDNLCKALVDRMDYFEEVGCRISDHSLEGYVYEDFIDNKSGVSVEELINSIFEKKHNGEEVSQYEAKVYRSYLLTYLASNYYKRGWIMQLHIGALRNNSTKSFEKIGVDSGFDSADDFSYASQLSGLLDAMEYGDGLPKTVIYNLNSKDNTTIATMLGNFQNSEARSKIQLGSAWWVLDHKRGMESQLESFAESGVLANFVGMVTDSRSMLSFTRHEYFRRILCNYIGNLVENGEYPFDKEVLSEIIRDICSNNIREYMKK